MAIPNITFANVRVNNTDHKSVADWNMELKSKPTSHDLQGQPFTPGVKKIKLDAVNNYGSDQESIIIKVIEPTPPTLVNARLTVKSNTVINYRLSGTGIEVSPKDLIKSVTWSATGLPPELSIDVNTGYITGTLKREYKGLINVTVTNNFGSATGILALNVIEYKYLNTATAPFCPVSPGYSGWHDHSVPMTLPDGITTYDSLYDLSTVSYSGRIIKPYIQLLSPYKYKYTYTKLDGTTEVRQANCYRKAKLGAKISGGSRSKGNIEHALWKARVEMSCLEVNEAVEPQHWYIDINFDYLYYAEDGKYYDPEGYVKI